MRKSSALLLLLAASVAVTGCTRKRGDEFAVAKAAPLVVPPDFALAPPITGTSGLSPSEAQQQAIDALFGGPAPRPQIETSLLDRAGQHLVKLGIRSNVWDPDTRVIDKGEATIALLQAQPVNTNIASAHIGQ